MSRTRSRTIEGRRMARRLAWALLLALTGCDQFFPYDKKPVQVCAESDTLTAYIGLDSARTDMTIQECWTEYHRATPPAPPCTTDAECAEAYPGTYGDPISDPR